MKKKKKVVIGDIAEIGTPSGLGYVQYIYDADTHGELVRVLPGLHKDRPADLAGLSRRKEMYFVFYTMNYAVSAGEAVVVSNQSVPGWAKSPPIMRHAAGYDDAGKAVRWRIINAGRPLTPQDLIRAPLVTELTPEQEKLSIREIWSHASLVRALARGWTPERAEEFRLQDVAEAKKNMLQAEISSEPMKHYLYFPKKPNAEEAAEQLRRIGFSVQVRKGASGEDWLALATNAPPKTGKHMDELRNELEALASRFGGEYDGWEAPIHSLGSQETERNRNVN